MPFEKQTTPNEPNQNQLNKKHPAHKLMAGDRQLFQKNTSCFLQCAATVGGQPYQRLLYRPKPDVRDAETEPQPA